MIPSTSRPRSSVASTTSRCATAPSASRRSSIASAALRHQGSSSLADASCGSASSAMKSWRGSASGSSTASPQVIKTQRGGLLFPPVGQLSHAPSESSPGSPVISEKCISSDDASDHVMPHCCLYDFPPEDPEFHLHIGGLLNPIPGRPNTQSSLLKQL